MRRLLPLLILLAACTSIAEDTTTTAPLAEPPTTTTTAPSTTATAEPTTTTTEEECVERDGALRNVRGFVCPPHLLALANTMGSIYLPGEYVTSLFEPAFTFDAPRQFRSSGQAVDVVQLDARAIFYAFPLMMAWSGEMADVFDRQRPFDQRDYTSNLRVSDVTVGGYPGTMIDFNVEEDPCAVEANPPCNVFSIDLPDEGLWGFQPGTRNMLIFVDVEGDRVVFDIEATTRSFDTYWTEVAQPILDSIEFLDP